MPILESVWSGEGWIDVSRPLSSKTPVWPGDRVFELSQAMIGDLLVSAVATTCHVGTHIDAPLHLAADGAAVEEVPLDRLIGPSEVVSVRVGARAVLPGDLPDGWSPSRPKVLLQTGSHPLDTPIADGFAGASVELVNWLADHGVSTLGIDTPSVDVFSSTELEAHHALVQHGMTWIEGLNLEGIDAGCFMLVALPMPLCGTEAAPVRAIIKRLGDD